MIRIGIDTGGTFTDFVVFEEGGARVFKLPSTPKQPEKAVLEGLARLVREGETVLIQLGSTVATNALLERKGATTLLITTHGFEDVVEIGRQNRSSLYTLKASKPSPLVPPRLRLGMKERILWDGSVLIPLERKNLEWLLSKVQQSSPESIAVVLLHSYANPAHELQIAEALRDSGALISLSHQVLPEFREFERTSATVLNAYLTPVLARFLQELLSAPTLQGHRLRLMQSNGGSVPARREEPQAVRTLLSGPAGGVVGAFETAREAGFDRIISLDMGGTSTDVCACDGRIPTTREAEVACFPAPVQMIDIHTVGSGGGSIAWVDSGGLLRVGPQSAGADPGPVCYGVGDRVTVTDAHVFLGRLDPDFFLGGELQLHPERIRNALESLGRELESATGRSWKAEEVAEGILRIVNTQMESALRVVSLQRGHDTRDFTLVCFGGAGGLHACEVSRTLGISRILIPTNPGVLSAHGILRCDVVRDRTRTVLLQADREDLVKRLAEAFEALEQGLHESLKEEGFSDEQIHVDRSLDVRYAGQSFDLNLPYVENFAELFHGLHEQRYGYANRSLPLEIVHVRVRLSGKLPLPEREPSPLLTENPPEKALVQEKQIRLDGEPRPTRFYLRQGLRPGNRIQGPAVVLEYSATTVIPHDFKGTVDAWHNLIVERLEEADGGVLGPASAPPSEDDLVKDDPGSHRQVQ